MKKLAILGASGHGKVVADTALQTGWQEVVFFDDAWPVLQKNGVYSVAGATEALLRSSEFDGVIVAIGDNYVRLKKTEHLLRAGFPLPVLVHPKAYLSKDAVIESGSVIFAGAIVQPGSVLGQAVIVNTGAIIDHDCTIAAGVHISPASSLAGGVCVGTCTWIGIGASINQGLAIGQNVVVGAGAAVICDLEDGLTVVGVPACAIKKKSTIDNSSNYHA